MLGSKTDFVYTMALLRLRVWQEMIVKQISCIPGLCLGFAPLACDSEFSDGAFSQAALQCLCILSGEYYLVRCHVEATLPLDCYNALSTRRRANTLAWTLAEKAGCASLDRSDGVTVAYNI